jgi:hypothetical protein
LEVCIGVKGCHLLSEIRDEFDPPCNPRLPIAFQKLGLRLKFFSASGTRRRILWVSAMESFSHGKVPVAELYQEVALWPMIRVARSVAVPMNIVKRSVRPRISIFQILAYANAAGLVPYSEGELACHRFPFDNQLGFG